MQHLGDRAARHGRDRASFRLRDFLIFLGVASGVMFLNQIRTLVAHLWENGGEPMSVTAQFLDSVNVPAAGDACRRCGRRSGLRYHALHHLLPGLPYHASARPTAACAASSMARRSIIDSTHRHLSALVVRLAASTLTMRRNSCLRLAPSGGPLRSPLSIRGKAQPP